MEQPLLNWTGNFIWGIADDVLRDVYVRGKYRDVILPMVVIRRLDAASSPTSTPCKPNSLPSSNTKPPPKPASTPSSPSTLDQAFKGDLY
jgi:hypothetical protein